MHFRRALLLGPCFLLAAALAGCSDRYGGRLAVRGEVTLKGEPLKEGSITFVPLDGQDTQSGAPVVNGAYTVPRANGLKPGKYLVQLTSGDGKTPHDEEAAAPGGSTNIVSLDLIPEEWNIRSTQKVEVTKDGDNKFNFNVPRANAPRKRR
ncbi:MAG TPA: hypothetical protein VFE78_19060 [Gemmataceae bacterium]|jgi:hypothetical protein|nr:hypothetical protein [Gemmataceae bacterium]